MEQSESDFAAAAIEASNSASPDSSTPPADAPQPSEPPPSNENGPDDSLAQPTNKSATTTNGKKRGPRPKDGPDLATLRTKMKGAIEFCEAMHIPYFKEDLFRVFGVSHSSGYRLISAKPPRAPDAPETRGRKRLLTKDDVRKMEEVLRRGPTEVGAPPFNWKALASAAGLDAAPKNVHPRTIRRVMGDLEYWKCPQCRKGWVNADVAFRRLTFARDMATQGPLFWRQVRFSDEMHLGLGPRREFQMIRRPGERYCVDCDAAGDLDEANKQQPDWEKKGFHCWVMVGWDYKSDLVFYEIPGNSHGVLNQKVYIESILEPVVRPLLERGDKQWIMEETGDYGHGSGSTERGNAVWQWKMKNGLQFYFNAPKSPDLCILDDCWVPVQKHLARSTFADEQALLNAVKVAWKEQVSQELINSLILSMDSRLREVIALEGQMTAF